MDKGKVYSIDWEKYLQPERLRQSGTHASIEWDSKNKFESDFGRVIFCPAIRRMHDKTQVIIIRGLRVLLKHTGKRRMPMMPVFLLY